MHRSSKAIQTRALVPVLLAALVATTAVPRAAAATSPAQSGTPRVAYIHNGDLSSMSSFKLLLESRGFAVDVVALGAVPNANFSADNLIIIGNDTGGSAPFTWLGTTAARDAIIRSEKSIITIGYGAQYFDARGGLLIGWGPSWISNGNSGLVMNPAAGVWTAPSPVPIAPDNSVKLYGYNLDYLAVYNPTANGVIRVAREVNNETHYPIAAQNDGPCYVEWGFRRAPNAMTSAGRDAFINLVTNLPCADKSPSVDVSIRKTANDAPATVGQPMTYTLTIVNNSRVTAPAVQAVDVLPAGVVFMSATPSQGTCSYSTGVVTCALGNMPGLSTATVAIVVRPTEAGTLINTARVRAQAADPDPSNNSSTAQGSAVQPPTFKAIYALPFNPVFLGTIAWLPAEDLSIFGIEVTEGIQCFNTSAGLTSCADNALPLVAKKDAAARIYLKYSGTSASKSNVKVRLFITDANNVNYTADATARALPSINQSSAADSANIYFNVNFNNSTAVKFHAVVDPDNAYTELNEGNNRYPASGDITLNFTKRKSPMKIVGQRLRYHPSGYSGTQYAGGWAVNGGAGDWYEQLLPIQHGGVNYVVNSGYLNWTGSMSGDGQHDLIKYLNSQWVMQNVFSWLFGSGAYTGARHVYGWVPSGSGLGGHADMPVYPHAGGYGVVAIGNDTPGTSTDNPGSGALIFGHELVHDYDVKHTNTADACGSNDNTSTFPYSSSSIQEFGFNPATGKVYDPSSTHDIMSYCPSGGSKQGWMSPFTWQAVFNKFNPSAFNAQSEQADEASNAATETAAPVLIINATLNNPDLVPDSGTLDDLFKVDTDTELITPAPGDYSVQLRGVTNTVLATHPFTLTFKSEYSGHDGPHPGDESPRPTASTVMVVPWVEGTTSVVLLHNGNVLNTKAVSANAPVVQITSPNAAANWPAGSTQTLTWTGSDADGDALHYSVFYSHNGTDWALMATGLTTTTFDVPVDSLAGSTNAAFRVVATDGVLTGDDATNFPITVPNQPPTPAILNPNGDINIPIGDLVVMLGTATDMEDGTLPDISLAWSSDKQGDLGTGSSLPVANLQPGLHTITLTATDSNGNTGQSTVHVYIGARVSLPLVVR